MPAEQSDTIVGANVELQGSLRNRGPIHIHGKVTGDISSDSLIVIGETAVVLGPINARQVDVAGKVEGAINAEEQIELQPKSFVKGDLTCSRLSIKPGATFVGKSNMQEPHAGHGGSAAAGEEVVEKKRPRLEIE